MFGFLSKKKTLPPPVSEIGPKSSFEGELESKREIRVWGTVKGEIKSALKIETKEGSSVEGTVSSPEIRIEGKFSGNAAAGRFLYLKAGACADGEFRAMKFKIEKGAFISGKLASQ